MRCFLGDQYMNCGLVLVFLLSLYFEIVESKCRSECNLALASYYVSPGYSLDEIGSYLNATVNDIISYNSDVIQDQDSIRAGIRINVPFPCGCVDDTFLSHIFTYEFQKGDTYDKVAQKNYTNLTSPSWIEKFNSYSPFNVPDGAIVNVPINCSCGESSVSKEYGLFITYPLRSGDTLSSISKHFNLSSSLLQNYNPGANFSAGTGLVYVPGKDKTGKYPPIGANGSGSSGLAIGAIVGICIAVVVGIIILSVGSYIGCKRRKKTKEASPKSVKPEYQSTHYDGQERLALTVDKSVEFSYVELAKATNNFDISCKIGEGGFGAVYYGELRGQKAAIKKMGMKASREFLAELKVLTNVHHLNLVPLLGYCVESSLFLVYEFVDNGNLREHLNSGRDPLSWFTRMQIALDSARGLEYIHEHTVPVYIHRDIKPLNILIDKNFHAKVADFGLAKLANYGNGSSHTRLVGTFGYMPPEYAQYGEVSPKVDVYAFGVVLFELISAKDAVVKGNRLEHESKGLVALFEEVLRLADPNEICKLIDPRLGDDYPLDSVRQVAELAMACTHDNLQLRPSMRSVVVTLTSLLSNTRNWDIDSFYTNDGRLSHLSGR